MQRRGHIDGTGIAVEERSRARVEERTPAGVTERTRAGVTERVTREKDIATRSAREGHERAAVQARMTRENARMTRENARAAVRQQRKTSLRVARAKGTNARR